MIKVKPRIEHLSDQPQQKLCFPKWEINNKGTWCWEWVGGEGDTQILSLAKEKDYLLTCDYFGREGKQK